MLCLRFNVLVVPILNYIKSIINSGYIFMKNYSIKIWNDPVWSSVIAMSIPPVFIYIYNFLFKIIDEYANLLINVELNIPLFVIVIAIIFIMSIMMFLITCVAKYNVKKISKIDVGCKKIHNTIEWYELNEIKNIYNILGYQQFDVSLAYKRNLCTQCYEPGTFTLAEIDCDPLFIKNGLDFHKWFNKIFFEEIELIKKQDQQLFNNKLKIEEIKKKVINILELKLVDGKNLKHHIWFQEYSDVIRRIIFSVIVSDPDYEIELYPSLTHESKKIALDSISYIDKTRVTVSDWLKISIAAGLLGIEKKSVHSATSNINRDIGIQLNKPSEKYENSIIRISNQLIAASLTKTRIDASEWIFNFFKSSEGVLLKIVSFPDDYIETIFLFKYYNELINKYKNIEIDLVPKSIKCGNDTTYDDAIDFLHFFPLLKSSNRFRIHKNGPKLATVNLCKLHPSIIDLIEQADLIDIRGARNYETMQGIKKEAFFGFMVSREFSESVIGLKSKHIPLIYIRQMPGEKSFKGFRMRHQRIVDGISLCTVTANDHKKKLQGGNISTYDTWPGEKVARFKSIQMFYKKNALDFHKKYGDHIELEVRECLQKMHGTVLVAGCGSGKEVNFLHKRGINSIGIDISFEAIKLAKLIYPELWSNFLIDDLYNIDFIENDKFDGAVFNAVLVHLLDRNDLFLILSHAKKIVKYNGLIFLRVLEKDNVLEEYDDVLFGYRRWFVYYTLNDIVSMCSKLNFQILYKDRRPHVQYDTVYWLSILIKNNKDTPSIHML